MLNIPQLPEDCYAVRLARELQVGDICVSVLFPDTNKIADPYQVPDAGIRAVALAACWLRALVLRVFEDLAIVAPIMTAQDAEDDAAFSTVVEARNNPDWIRLPPLDGEWKGDAIAYLFMPYTVPVSALRDRRATSLTREAREVVAVRLAQAFQ